MCLLFHSDALPHKCGDPWSSQWKKSMVLIKMEVKCLYGGGDPWFAWWTRSVVLIGGQDPWASWLMRSMSLKVDEIHSLHGG